MSSQCLVATPAPDRLHVSSIGTAQFRSPPLVLYSLVFSSACRHWPGRRVALVSESASPCSLASSSRRPPDWPYHPSYLRPSILVGPPRSWLLPHGCTLLSTCTRALCFGQSTSRVLAYQDAPLIGVLGPVPRRTQCVARLYIYLQFRAL